MFGLQMLMQVYGVGYRPDPLNQLSGALRFVNVTVHCDGSNTPKLQGFVDHSERSSPPIPAGPESAKSDFSDLNLLLPGVWARLFAGGWLFCAQFP